jgi:hypothetical protein
MPQKQILLVATEETSKVYIKVEVAQSGKENTFCKRIAAKYTEVQVCDATEVDLYFAVGLINFPAILSRIFI